MPMLPIIVSFALAAAFTWLFSSRFTPLKILDHPNERSLHVAPVHRTGGLAILIGAFLAVLLSGSLGLLNEFSNVFILSAAVLLFISFLDDLRHVAIGIRFLTQALAAFLVCFYFLGIQLIWLFPVAIALVWMINLYNFMDGMDGFAGGMSAIGFGFFSLIAYQQGAIEPALLCALIASASVGFLLFNFPPAKIFMGDAGSTLMGFFAGIAILYFHLENLLFAGLGVLLFSPFIIDATVTLLRRMYRGEKFWLAHRTHYYQRLVQAGWGHKATVLVEYGLMLLCGGTVLLVAQQPALQWPVMAGWLSGYAVIMLWLEKRVLRRA